MHIDRVIQGKCSGMPNDRVLIINNQAVESNIFIDVFRDIGYCCSFYDRLSVALKNEKNFIYDLAVIDISLMNSEENALLENFKFSYKIPILYILEDSKKNKFLLDKSNYIERPMEVNTVRSQIQNILRLKAIQDELLFEKEKFTQVFEHTSNEMILTDLDCNIFAQNNKILSKSDFQYSNFLDLLKERVCFEQVKQLEAFLDSSENTLNLNLVFDDVIFVKATISKLFNGNKSTSLLIILEDCCHEVEMTQMRSCFIDMLNHHLKTPVRAEKRVLQLLLDNSFGALTPEQNDIVQEMYNSSRFMLHMMDNVLTMFKLNSEDFSLNKNTNSIKKTIQKCVENLSYMFKSKNQSVKISSFIETEAECVFDYDEIEIKRVLENIIVNASEHSPKSSEILITIKKVSNFVQVSVKDNGAGISQDSLDSILNDCWYEQRFKKVGSGLGLYITKKIIERHGGSLSIVSNTSSVRGTECTFSLPCVRESAIVSI